MNELCSDLGYFYGFVNNRERTMMITKWVFSYNVNIRYQWIVLSGNGL